MPRAVTATKYEMTITKSMGRMGIFFRGSVVAAVAAGGGGTAKPDMKERTRGALQKCFPGAAVTILTDFEAALAAAGEGPAIVLIVGTGSAAFGRNVEGETTRAGGYGPSSSDHGSAYDMGKRAIAAAIQERRNGSDSPLRRQILFRLCFPELPVVQPRPQTIPA